MPNEEIDLDLDAIDLDGLDFDSSGKKAPAAPVEVEVMEDSDAHGDAIEIDVEAMLADPSDDIADVEIGAPVPDLEAPANAGHFETIRPGDVLVDAPAKAPEAPRPPAVAAVPSGADGVDIDALFKDLLAEEPPPVAGEPGATSGLAAEWTPPSGPATTDGFGAEWGPTAGLSPAPTFDADAFVLDSLPPTDPAADLAEEPAPILTLSPDEPAPVPSPDIQSLSDPETLRAFHQLAGATAAPTPEESAAALRAALVGEPHDAAALPDARTIAIGIGRLLADRMGSSDELVQAILGAEKNP